MNTKMRWLLGAMMFAMAVLLMGGCSKDDDPSDPDNKVPDPEGTVTVNISESYDQYGRPSYVNMGSIEIRWTAPNNIECASYEHIANVGQMKGLANIIKVPENGWSSNVSCESGCGYIGYDGYDDPRKYTRFYVVKSITNVLGEIIGAEVKYQKDWIPEKE